MGKVKIFYYSKEEKDMCESQDRIIKALNIVYKDDGLAFTTAKTLPAMEVVFTGLPYVRGQDNISAVNTILTSPEIKIEE